MPITNGVVANREERLSALIENSSDVIMLLDRDGTILFASDAIAQVSGYRPEQVIGRHGFQTVHPDDLARVTAAFDRCRSAAGTRFSIDYRAQLADGTWQQREVTAVNRLDNPAVGAVVLNYRDVTERRRIEAALVKSEADYRSSFESAPIGIAHTGLDGRWLRVNERLRTLLGYSAQQFHSTDFRSLTHPDDVESNTEARGQLLAGRIPRYAVEKRYRRADGTYLWANLTVSLHRDDRGEPSHFIAAVEDISARKHAEQELAHIFDLSPDMICTADYDGYFTRINAAFVNTLGHTAEQLQTARFLTFVHDDDQAATLREIDRLTTGRTTVGFTNRYRTAAGAYRWIEWHARADTDARLIHAVARDQTDKRLLEEQLRQAQKMEAVGRLAGGVAHGFNNLLTTILGFAELTLDQCPEGDPRRGDVEQILRAGNGAKALTNRLTAFSRKQILAPQVIDLNGLVRGMSPLLGRLLGDGVELTTALDEALPSISADPGQVEQVIMNLAVNASDAMPAGGRVRISTDTVDFDEAFVATHPEASGGRHIRLTVSDSGVGMSPGVVAHLFEPFFTTKEQGTGTGLGLATVYGIVQQSGGFISVNTEEGQGASFAVYFPGIPAAAAATVPTS